MATLEKIRSKSVFLIIVIGVALLAFIVGDAISNGRNLFGKGSRIAKAGNKQIDISEYQNREQNLSNLYRDQGADGSEIASVALQQLIDEAFIDQAVEQMGIDVDDTDLAFYIFDNPVPQVQMFIAQNFGQGVTPAQAADMINNPTKYGLQPESVEGLKAGWMGMESEVRKAVKRNLYMNLVAGAIKPNALDRKDMHARATESVKVNLAVKPFDKTLLSQYKVSNAELNKAYNENKQMFKVSEPSTTIGFVYAQVPPSGGDTDEAKKLTQMAVDALKKGTPINAAMQKQGIRPDKASLPKYYINSNYAHYPYNAEMIVNAPLDSVVSTISGNYYINFKKTGTTTANDSIEVSIVEVPNAQLADVETMLKNGTIADSIPSRTGNKAVLLGKETISIQNPNMRNGLPSDVLSQLDNAVAGEVITLMKGDAKTPTRLMRVEKATPVTLYQFEAANYQLLPSSNTMTDAREKMEAFASKNKSAAAFAKNAAAAGYQYMPVTVTPSTPNIAAPNQALGFRTFPNSSAIVQWALGDVTSGEVSDVIDNNDAQNPWIYVAIVADQAEEYLPVTNPVVKEKLTEMVQRQKAGDALVKQYSGKGTIEATAEAMGVTVNQLEDLRFGGAAGINDLPVSARIIQTAPGNQVYVIKGDNGVYAYQVVEKNTNTTPSDKNKEVSTYRGIFTPSGNQVLPYAGISKMLRGNKKVENNRYELMGRN